MDLKKFLRGAALYLLSAGVFFLLFALAYFLVFSLVTANPDKVKQVLADSGAYQKVPAVIYDEAAKTASKPGESPSDIPLKLPLVRQAALDAFTPSLFQNNVEDAIDNAYGWLDGKNGQPKFKIKLEDAKKRFAKSLSRRVGKRLQRLPECDAAQVSAGSGFDPYKSACLPPGTNISTIKRQIRRSISGDSSFLKDVDISPNNFKTADGQPVLTEQSRLPETYRTALKLPYILALLIALISVSVVFVAQTKAAGFKKLAFVFALGGVFVLLIPLGFKTLFDTLTQAADGNRAITDLGLPILKEFNKAAAKVYYVTGGLYAALAAGAFLMFRHLHKPDKPEKKT